MAAAGPLRVAVQEVSVSTAASSAAAGAANFQFSLGLVKTATITLRNTIIANSGVRECFFDGLGPVNNAGSGNLIVQNFGCPGMVSMSDPQLGSLQLNAPGSTPTMAITTSSPAFNAGDDANCQMFDQRGVSRPQFMHCDIGAYEVGCSMITCPANVTQANDPNQCGATVTYPAPTTNGSCTPVCSPPSGSLFPVGITTVTCSADSTSCTFTVTVNDTQPPTITCPANIMTCLNSYFQDAMNESLGESLLKSENGGAVAVWASSGMTLPQEQQAMNQELYRLLFSPNNRALPLGEIMRQAKQR